jgi:hypothetical protein
MLDKILCSLQFKTCESIVLPDDDQLDGRNM